MMEQVVPHVVLHPLPTALGHIKPLLCLAQLLSEAGFHITFVITHHTHKNLENLSTLSTQFPNLHLKPISDGLPDDHPRSLTLDFFYEIKTKTKPHFKELLLLLNTQSPPVTCIINDGYVSYPIDVAEELKIPIFTFCPHSACYLLSQFCIPKLIEDGHLPFSDEDMNHEINGVPGLEGLLRRKGLPAFCVLKDVQHPAFQFLVKEIFAKNDYSSGLIINSFDELEVQTLPQFAPHYRKVYTVGPLHAFMNSKNGQYHSQLITSHSCLWKADQNCIAWLDSQPSRSVLYVSFGSLIKMSISQLMEFRHGLVNSGHPFLWVIRPDVTSSEEEQVIPEELQMGAKEKGYIVDWALQEEVLAHRAVEEEQVIPEELQMGAKEKGYIVDWAPQEEVLAHRAVGGFFTHSGWNSILESIMTKIPMICWPHASDQHLNTQLVCKVLRIGFELEACDRSTIQAAVETLMGAQMEKFQESINRIAKFAEDGISQAGISSSNHNIQSLVSDIKKIKLN